MPLARAENAWVGFGVETVLGTTVARTKFMDFVSESLTRRQVRRESGVLGGNSNRIVTELSRWSEGSIEFEGNYEGLELLFKHAFGTAASVVASGAAVNHTFTLAANPPSPGLSVETNRDVAAFLYADCKIGQMEISQGTDEYARIRFDVLGRAETIPSASSPSFPADQRILVQELIFKIATVTTPIHNFRWTLNNNMAHRPQLGSVDRKEVQRVGRRRVSGSFEMDFETTTQYNQFINQTSVALLATWTGAVITGAETYRLVLNMPLCKFLNAEIPVGGPGPITKTIEFLALEQTRGAQDEVTAIIESTAASIP